jgi:serine/threonine-protein kinase
VNRDTGIWVFQRCYSIPGIYNPNQTTSNPELGARTPPATSSSGSAMVFDPPSNIRVSPNGDILCSVTSKGVIPIQRKYGEWYETNYCGEPGFIHQSQIRF